MDRMREVLVHMCVVCSLVCIMAKILDWYNPYMDFTGHIWEIQIILYISVIVLAFTKESRRRVNGGAGERHMGWLSNLK